MARVKLDMKGVEFVYRTELEVRITDINYGRHVGNDAMLGLLHEARLRFLAQFGFSEEDIGGVGMLMGDAVVQFKGIAVRGDRLVVEMGLAMWGARVRFRSSGDAIPACAPTSTGRRRAWWPTLRAKTLGQSAGSFWMKRE
jgi:acyl-CoA thioesterase FadM